MAEKAIPINAILDWVDVIIKKDALTNHYDPIDHTIHISRMNDSPVASEMKRLMGRPESSRFAFLHELGHAFFESYAVDEYQEAWDLFGDFDQDYYGNFALIGSVFYEEDGRYITRYAQTHPEEDFADTFAFLLDNEGIVPASIKNRTLKKKMKFIRSCLKDVV